MEDDGPAPGPPEPAETISLNDYIAATGDASQRSRWSLPVLIVASIFGYASHLSAQSNGWPWRRLDLLETTVRCVTELEHGPADAAPSTCTEEDASRAGKFLLRWEYTNTEAKTRAELSRLHIDVDLLKHHVQHQRDIIMDRLVNQTVPVLGFGFDGNDLGKIATLTFIVMLLVLFLALRRERQNVQILRYRARSIVSRDRSHVLSEARGLICMRQVFSIVSNISSVEAVDEDLLKSNKKQLVALFIRIMSGLRLLLVWFPILVEIQIAYMDLNATSVGQALSLQSTSTLFLWGRLGGLISIVLAILCNREQLALDREFAPRKWIAEAA